MAVKYGPTQSNGLMYSYGFDVNARGAGQLPNRPAMIDQPFGSGRALLLGTNPFYRAWIDGEERLVGNGILFPLGAPIAPNASAAAVAAAAEPAAAPVAAAKLPASRSRPDTGGRNTSKDLMIKVKRSQSAALKSAVKRRSCHEAARQGPLSEHAHDDHPRHAQRPQRRPARPHHVGDPDHGRTGQPARPRHLRAGLADRGGPATRRPLNMLQLTLRGGGERAERPLSPVAPVPLIQPIQAGLVRTSGRSAGVARRGVREGCRPLGHAYRITVRGGAQGV